MLLRHRCCGFNSHRQRLNHDIYVKRDGYVLVIWRFRVYSYRECWQDLSRHGSRIFERGWPRKVFEKRAANKTKIQIYYHNYIRTLDICSHLFIQLLYIYSYKLTQQYHYSHSGCLIVYKKQRCSLHDMGSPVTKGVASHPIHPPP